MSRTESKVDHNTWTRYRCQRTVIHHSVKCHLPFLSSPFTSNYDSTINLPLPAQNITYTELK